MKKLALIAAAALLLTAGISQAAETAAAGVDANATTKVEKTEKHVTKHHAHKHHAKHAAHAAKKPATDVSTKADGTIKANQ